MSLHNNKEKMYIDFFFRPEFSAQTRQQYLKVKVINLYSLSTLLCWCVFVYMKHFRVEHGIYLLYDK